MGNVAAAGPSSDRVIGALTIASAIAGFALLAAHPAEQAHNFAEVVQQEARQQMQDLIVHGGYILVLSLQILCFGFFSSRLSGARIAAGAAKTFFAIGAAWICVSLLFDGLVTPAIATRYVNQPDAAHPLFVLISAVVRYVMPIGLTFQALAVACWGIAMLSSRLRISGAIASLLGAGLLAAVAIGALGGMPVAYVGAFAAMALWPLIAGVVLLRAIPTP